LREPFFNSKYGYDILRNLVAARYTYTLALIFGETIVFQRPQDVEIKEAPFEMKLAILSDFDGTVTLNDTFENVLENSLKATGGPLMTSTLRGRSHWRNVSEDRARW